MKYKYKPTLLLKILTCLMVGLSVYLFIVSAITKSKEQLISGIIVLTLFAVIVSPVYFMFYYEITDNNLIIKNGYLRRKVIPVDTIVVISRAHHPIISTVISNSSLTVYYKKDNGIVSELITLKEQQEFVDALSELNPEIKVNIDIV